MPVHLLALLLLSLIVVKQLRMGLQCFYCLLPQQIAAAIDELDYLVMLSQQHSHYNGKLLRVEG